jgi:hypothetical protein
MKDQNNFWRYCDQEGKMPFLYNKLFKIKSHPFYVQYRNNKPVAYHGPIDVVGTNGKIWDYSVNEYVDAATISEE